MENTVNKTGLRPLNIDYDQYTDGESEFQWELVSLMITDIRELRKTFVTAALLQDPEVFLRGLHKAKTTVEIINDAELSGRLKELKAEVAKDKNNKQVISRNTVLFFDKIFTELLKSLTNELEETSKSGELVCIL